jgi:hypothetical protein
MSNDLSQSEADFLLSLEKHATNAEEENFLSLPDLGGKLAVPLISSDGNEEFILDIYRHKINLKKGTFQNRSRQTIILARLDIGGAPHRNPDGEEIKCPHLHLYREGYNDKWAYEVPNSIFTNPENWWQSLQDFIQYCNITKMPNLQRGLFS